MNEYLPLWIVTFLWISFFIGIAIFSYKQDKQEDKQNKQGSKE